MNYYRLRRQVLEMDAGGGRIEVSTPVLDDGIVYERLHDYGDDRGIIVATESSATEYIEAFDVSDEVVASHLRWNTENPCDGAGRFVLNNGLVEVVS